MIDQADSPGDTTQPHVVLREELQITFTFLVIFTSSGRCWSSGSHRHRGRYGHGHLARRRPVRIHRGARGMAIPPLAHDPAMGCRGAFGLHVGRSFGVVAAGGFLPESRSRRGLAGGGLGAGRGGLLLGGGLGGRGGSARHDSFLGTRIREARGCAGRDSCGTRGTTRQGGDCGGEKSRVGGLEEFVSED